MKAIRPLAASGPGRARAPTCWHAGRPFRESLGWGGPPAGGALGGQDAKKTRKKMVLSRFQSWNDSPLESFWVLPDVCVLCFWGVRSWRYFRTHLRCGRLLPACWQLVI